MVYDTFPNEYVMFSSFIMTPTILSIFSTASFPHSSEPTHNYYTILTVSELLCLLLLSKERVFITQNYNRFAITWKI